MKKLFVFLFALIFATSLSVPVLAEDNDFDLVCTHSVTEDGKILVKASITDITDETGIVLVEYHVLYDQALLRLDNYKASMPESWVPFLDSGKAEDVTTPIKNGLIWWVLNCEPGSGITEDDVLFIELEFSFLTDSPADIEFTFKCAGGDDPALIPPLYGPDRYIHVEPSEAPETSVEAPSEVESSEVESSEAESSEVESGEAESSEAESSEVESSEVESSNVEVVPDEPNEDESGMDSSASDTINSESNIEETSAASSVVASSTPVSDNSAVDDDTDGGNGLTIAIIAAVVIIVGAMVVVIVKKGKK